MTLMKLHQTTAQSASKFEVITWGALGSFPANGPDFNEFGGSTCCIELHIDDRIVMLDAGSGIVALGDDLIQRDVRSIDLIISHAHLDHVMGFPYFAPPVSTRLERHAVVCWRRGRQRSGDPA